MGYAFKPTESLRAGISRVAQEQIDLALESLENTAEPIGERVHAIRRRCKNLRALIRTAETAMPAQFPIEDAAISEAAKFLSGFRDSDVMLGLQKELRAEGLARSPGLTRWESQLTHDLRRRSADDNELRQMELCGLVLENVWSRIGSWRVRGKASVAIRESVGKTYGRARKRMLRAQREHTPKAYHAWRRHVKYHYNHMRLFHFVWPEMMDARAKTAQRLGQCLGDAHDLAMYQDAVRCQTANSELQNELEHRQQVLYEQALLLGERLFRPPAGAFSRHLAYLWRLSRKKA